MAQNPKLVFELVIGDLAADIASTYELQLQEVLENIRYNVLEYYEEGEDRGVLVRLLPSVEEVAYKIVVWCHENSDVEDLLEDERRYQLAYETVHTVWEFFGEMDFEAVLGWVCESLCIPSP